MSDATNQTDTGDVKLKLTSTRECILMGGVGVDQ